MVMLNSGWIGFSSFQVVFPGCRWFWVVVGCCWLSPILVGCGRLRVILTIVFSVERFWVALGVCD